MSRPRIFFFFGGPGTTKTTLALSGNGLKEYFETDSGSFDRAENGLRIPEGELNVHRYRRPLSFMLDRGRMEQLGSGPTRIQHNYDGWDDVFQRFLVDYATAVTNGNTASVIVDTITRLDDFAINAYREREQKEVRVNRGQRPSEYAERNDKLSAVIEDPKGYGKDVVLVAHEKGIWSAEENKYTGKFTFDGWPKAADSADCCLRLTTQGSTVIGEFSKAGGADLDVLGLKVINPTIPRLHKLLDAAGILRRMGIPVHDFVASGEDSILAAAERFG